MNCFNQVGIALEKSWLSSCLTTETLFSGTQYTHRDHKLSIIMSWCDLLSLVLMGISIEVMFGTQATMSLTSTHWPHVLFHIPFSEAVIVSHTHAHS